MAGTTLRRHSTGFAGGTLAGPARPHGLPPTARAVVAVTGVVRRFAVTTHLRGYRKYRLGNWPHNQRRGAVVGAAIRRDGVPAPALRRALRGDGIAVSEAIMAELFDVFDRPRLARFLDPGLRAELLSRLHAFGVFFTPTIRVTDCRDAKDDMHLELALACGAGVIVSSDADLLVPHPWRDVRIPRPADDLVEAENRLS